MAVSNEIDFLKRLSGEVMTALGPLAAGVAPPEFREGSNHSATFGHFIQRVLEANPNQKLILMFDEYELFENKIASGALNEDVLYLLANLIERQSVFIVFTGSQYLEARRAEYWKILGKSLYKTITYLERNDALNLIRRPVAGRLRYEDDTVERIVRLTAGQPFYTQAICQSIVDHANERHTAVASPEILAGVVENLVENPLAQMIFMWDGLERDQKLVLALLAESLPAHDSYVTANDLARSIDRRDYPLDLSHAQISTALEDQFQSEMLLRSDASNPPGYAFRMDLWRLWIRRMHSVWQVMIEEGLEVPRGRRGVPRRAMVGIIVALVLAVVAVTATTWMRSRGVGPSAAGGAGPAGSYTLHVEPVDAHIYQNRRLMGLGTFTDSIPANTEHAFRVTAAGHADSEFTVRVGAGEVRLASVALRPLLGDLAISTVPSGADVSVDGTSRGKSPLVVRGLRVSQPVQVEASRAGFGVAMGTFTVMAGQETPASLTLAAGKTDVLVTTNPTGAEIRIDGKTRGVSPLQIRGLPIGRHAFAASRDGYAPADSTLLVTESSTRVDLALRAAPPGILVVQGDRPAQIYLNGVLIVENVQNSGPRELPPGAHQVHVVLMSGEAIDQSVTIQSGERSTYDYSKGVVTRKAP